MIKKGHSAMTLKDTIARLFGSSAATVDDSGSPAQAPQTAPAEGSEPEGQAGEVTESQTDAGSDAVAASASDGEGADAPAAESTT